MLDYFSFLYFDWTILLIIPGIIAAIWAQSKVTRAYRTYTDITVSSGITGREAAERILAANGIFDVRIEAASGMLSDNYNPRKKTVNLSQANYSGRSIAAVTVAAHESGHALQHGAGYFPLSVRSLIAPVVSIASSLLWPVLIIGMLMGFAGTLTLAVYIFLGVFIFQLITLPVEFNASRRALAAIDAQRILTDEERYGAKKMLSAAALTYVAATLVALLNLVRFLSLSRRR
ncbi:MAG: zinc metallopeptidase [Christensenellales bacterium]